MLPISVFLNTAKVSGFREKNAEANRTQGVCYVTYTFYGSSLGKV